MSQKEKIINIAVIAHVDAGKSTLVDAFLNQSGVFRANEEVVDCVMDSDDIERERGITIYSKNCSIMHNDVKINIVDFSCGGIINGKNSIHLSGPGCTEGRNGKRFL